MPRLCLDRGDGHVPSRSPRSLGWKLASVNAVLNTAGLLILVIGAVRGLL
jgi:hypothetical protein